MLLRSADVLFVFPEPLPLPLLAQPEKPSPSATSRHRNTRLPTKLILIRCLRRSYALMAGSRAVLQRRVPTWRIREDADRGRHIEMVGDYQVATVLRSIAP